MMRGLASFAITLALWQGIVALGLLPAFVLPAPVAVIETALKSRALLATHFAVTLIEVLSGLFIGAILGMSLAVMLQLLPPLRRYADPVLAASQSVPVFVLAPVLTIWLGYGLGPKVAMTVLIVFFPVLSSLTDAMDALPEADLDLARIAGASRWRSVRFLRFPHAQPSLASGLRVAATYAPTGAVIGEWIGASKGLGYLMLMANARSQTALMFAALALILGLTVTLRAGVTALMRRWV